jgi:hypothetical protein
VSNSNKPRRKNANRDDNDGNRNDSRDDSQDKLSKAFQEITGEELGDGDRQHLFRIMQSMGVQDNDAIYSIVISLYGYEKIFGRIPDKIQKAADTEIAKMKAAGQLAVTQATGQFNESVLALLPGIRADVTRDVSRAATTAIRRIEFGRGMLSLWAGGLIASGLIVLGILIDSGVYRYWFTHPKEIQTFSILYGWQIAIALSLPPFLGLGLYAIENDYSTESKFAGWVIIAISIVTFTIPGLKIMGWWFWK